MDRGNPVDEKKGARRLGDGCGRSCSASKKLLTLLSGAGLRRTVFLDGLDNHRGRAVGRPLIMRYLAPLRAAETALCMGNGVGGLGHDRDWGARREALY